MEVLFALLAERYARKSVMITSNRLGGAPHNLLVVNTLSVTLLTSRGLWITAALYTAFWINAAVALVRWKRLVTSR